MIQSRGFALPGGKAGALATRFMLPLADLFNHGGETANFLLNGASTSLENIRCGGQDAFLMGVLHSSSCVAMLGDSGRATPRPRGILEEYLPSHLISIYKEVVFLWKWKLVFKNDRSEAAASCLVAILRLQTLL